MFHFTWQILYIYIKIQYYNSSSKQETFQQEFLSLCFSSCQTEHYQGPETLYRRPIQILIAKRHRGVEAMSYIISASHVACSTCLIIQRTRKLFKGPVNLTY